MKFVEALFFEQKILVLRTSLLFHFTLKTVI